MASIAKAARRIREFRPSDESIVIAYKALHDALLIEVVFFALAILAESIIPGIIIAYVGFSKIIILVALTMVATAWLGRSEAIRKLDIRPGRNKKKALIAFVVFAVLILFNSELKLNVFLNLSVIALSLTIGYLIFGILSEKESA